MEKFAELFEQAEAAYDDGNYAKAIELYTAALELNQQSAAALTTCGFTYDDLGEYQKAIEDYAQALVDKPKYADAFYNRGVAYATLGEDKKAIEDYTQAINQKPDYADAIYNRGNAYAKLGEYQKAIEDYDQAIGLDPKDETALNNCGNAYTYLDNYKKAIENYTKAIKYGTKNPFVFSNRANAYMQLETFEQAQKDYEKAAELGKDVYYELERAKEAAENPKLAKAVFSIRQTLRFRNDKISHYTSLTAARQLLLGDQRFRFSNTAHLNDPSEGSVLPEFLTGTETPATRGSATPYHGSPYFIGSFVMEPNDLTLWRFYGKEQQREAAGCSITFDPKIFTQGLSPKENDLIKEFPFPYRVAYMDNEGRIYLDGKQNDDLKKEMDNLKAACTGKSREELLQINLINEIRYLFKHADYRHENECRFVIHKAGGHDDVKLCTDQVPPRLYIELSQPHLQHVKRVVIGPKANQAEEWAAAFSFHFSKNNLKIPVEISTLPFK